MENVFHHGVAFGKQSKDYTEISGKLSKDSIKRFGKEKEQKSNYNEPEYTGNDWANGRLAVDEKQIEEMASKIRLTRRGYCIGGIIGDVLSTPDEIAEELCNEGYHKTVWHKVADGDLPKIYKEVLLLDENYDYYMGSYCKDDESFHTDIGFDMGKNKVIAWTELPAYKE